MTEFNEEAVKKSINEEIRSYLGSSNRALLRSTTKEENELFRKVRGTGFSRRESYLVKGSRSLLNKFKAFFILSFAPFHLPYETGMLKEYVEDLSHGDEDALIQLEKDILFLYCHGCSPGVGGTESWLSATAVDKIANRNRKGLVTVILSERELPLIESSNELKVINLGGAIKIKEAGVIAKEISNSSFKNMSDGTQY